MQCKESALSTSVWPQLLINQLEKRNQNGKAKRKQLQPFYHTRGWPKGVTFASFAVIYLLTMTVTGRETTIIKQFLCATLTHTLTHTYILRFIKYAGMRSYGKNGQGAK